MNEDALLPLIDQMLECREKFCEEVNELYGLNISVELNSSWKKIRNEVDNAESKDEAETEILENEAESTPEGTEEGTEEGENNENEAD